MNPQSEYNRRFYDPKTESDVWARRFWLSLVLTFFMGVAAGTWCYVLGVGVWSWTLAWGTAIAFLIFVYSTYRLDKALFEETDGEDEGPSEA